MKGKVLPLVLGVLLVFFVVAGYGKLGNAPEPELESTTQSASVSPIPTAEVTPAATATPTPIPSPTSAPTVAPTEEPVQSDVTYVWISYSGSKYHSNPNCSGMKGPSQVTLDAAIAMGKEPCSKCY